MLATALPDRQDYLDSAAHIQSPGRQNQPGGFAAPGAVEIAPERCAVLEVRARRPFAVEPRPSWLRLASRFFFVTGCALPW